jgi:hypothetical protein
VYNLSIYKIKFEIKGSISMISEKDYINLKNRFVEISKTNIVDRQLRIFAQAYSPELIEAVINMNVYCFQNQKPFVTCLITVAKDKIVINLYAMRYSGKILNVITDIEIMPGKEFKFKKVSKSNNIIFKLLYTFFMSKELTMARLLKLGFFNIGEIAQAQKDFYHDSIDEFNIKHKTLMSLNSRYNNDFSVFERYIVKKATTPKIEISMNKIYIVNDGLFITMEFREDTILFINEDNLILYDVVEIDHNVSIQYNDDYWAVLYCLDLVLNALETIRMQEIKRSKLVENIINIGEKNQYINAYDVNMRKNILLDELK